MLMTLVASLTTIQTILALLKKHLTIGSNTVIMTRTVIKGEQVGPMRGDSMDHSCSCNLSILS